MVKIRFLVLEVVLVLSGSWVHAQLPDGTQATASFVKVLQDNYIPEQSMTFDPENIDTVAHIPIHIFIIRNILGTSGITPGTILNSIVIANSFFMDIGIRFFVDSLVYVNDYNPGYITFDRNREELLTQYALPDGINLYLADSVAEYGIKCFGFTYFPDAPDSNHIFMDKHCFTGNALTTQLGHYMGLLSTHDTLGEAERVSESNCSTAGDRICDTYADPDLSDQVEDCGYTGNARDEEGRYYVPSVANIMSNTSDECKCIFTPLQKRRMYYYFHKYRVNSILLHK